MPFTRTPAQAVTMVQALVHGIPVSAVQTDVCEFISNDLWTYRPWRWTINQLTPITMVDGTQDYSPPAQIYRLVRARLTRTDVTPDESYPLDVMEYIEPSLQKVSPLAIRTVSQDYPTGLLRLGDAIAVASGTTWVLEGDFQPHPTQITSVTMNTNLWFPDQYFPVFLEGVKWKFYELADDQRAGSLMHDVKSGQIRATGQLGIYWAMREQMAMAEDAQNQQPFIYPEVPLGVSRIALDLSRF